MTDFGDIRLDRTPEEPPKDEGGRRGLWAAVLIGVAVLLVAALIFFMLRRSATQEPAARQETEQAVSEPQRAADLPAEPGEDIELPPLDETDPLVRELVRQLSSHPTVAAWLVTDQLLRNFTVVVLNIANGRTPVRHVRALAPTERFRTAQRDGTMYVDPRSYERYNGHADAIAALDARGVARLYATLKPRIVEAYRQQGYPEGDFDPVLERAIVELLRTPIVEGRVALTPQSKTISLAYADPQLESLSAAQKQLLRMGPRNVRRVQDRLREIARRLGIPDARLPPPGVNP